MESCYGEAELALGCCFKIRVKFEMGTTVNTCGTLTLVF